MSMSSIFDSSFDFPTYLHSLDASQPYTEVEVLTGGIVNITVRVSRYSSPPAASAAETQDEKDSKEGRFHGHSSIILKHAPPYIAAKGAGVGAEFGVFRQVRYEWPLFTY